MTPEVEALIKAAIVADIFRMAEACYWRRRAEQMEWAKPTAAEMLGAGPDRIKRAREQWRRCHAAAQNCRDHANLLEGRWPREASSRTGSVAA